MPLSLTIRTIIQAMNPRVASTAIATTKPIDLPPYLLEIFTQEAEKTDRQHQRAYLAEVGQKSNIFRRQVAYAGDAEKYAEPVKYIFHLHGVTLTSPEGP